MQIHTSNALATFIALPCGRTVPAEDMRPGDYLIRYISGFQRMPDNPVEIDVMRRGRLLKTVDIQGVSYAELWQYPG